MSDKSRERELLRTAEQLAGSLASSEPNAAATRPGWLRALGNTLGNTFGDLGEGVASFKSTGQALLLAIHATQELSRRVDHELQQLRLKLEESLQQKTGLDDQDYVAFEDRFRGSFEEIRQRLTVYSPHFEALAARTPGAKVFEFGAGRGEMAEVVMAAGLSYSCVDTNPAMVEQLKQRGADARVGDGLASLRLIPEKSLGAIVAIHVIEHVPFRQLTELFTLAASRLPPGGLLILETPNATSLTSLMSFPLDPTHLRPIHPLGLQFLADRSGFDLVRAEASHGPPPLEHQPANVPGAEVYNRNVDRLNECLFAGHDYSFVGRRRHGS